MTTLRKDLDLVLSRRSQQLVGMARDPANPVTLEVTLFDRSGSMSDYGAVPQIALSEHVVGLKMSPAADDIAIAVITFSDDARFDVPLAWVKDVIFPERIATNNQTRLYGTTKDVLQDLLPAYRLAVHRGLRLQVIVRVYTDGQDNLSTQIDRLECVRLTAEGRDLGWQFFVTGFGVDASRIARDMGFPFDAKSAVTMSATAQSIRHATGQSTRHTVQTSMGPPPEKDEDPPSLDGSH